jgi:uncharacterized YigZ family protein
MISPFYNTIEKVGYGEFKDKGSSHLGLACRADSKEEVETMIQNLRSEHPKANHICYAWRIRIAHQLTEYCTDDGEPSNSAGAPILGQLKSHELENTMVAVVRYFGGTKLGVSGLIRAYRSAAQLAIENSTIKKWEDQVYMNLELDYSVYHQVMDLIKTFEAHIVSEKHDIKSNLSIQIGKSKLEDVTEKLNRISTVKVVPEKKFTRP